MREPRGPHCNIPLSAAKTQHSSLKPCTLLLILQNEVRVGFIISSYLHFLLVLKISCVILYFNPPVQNNVAFLLQIALHMLNFLKKPLFFKLDQPAIQSLLDRFTISKRRNWYERGRRKGFLSYFFTYFKDVDIFFIHCSTGVKKKLKILILAKFMWSPWPTFDQLSLPLAALGFKTTAAYSLHPFQSFTWNYMGTLVTLRLLSVSISV